LHLNPANARQYGDRNLEAFRASRASFGPVEPLVVHRPSQRVIGGNGSFAAMKSLPGRAPMTRGRDIAEEGLTTITSAM
jgi:hypothetical protein